MSSFLGMENLMGMLTTFVIGVVTGIAGLRLMSGKQITSVARSAVVTPPFDPKARMKMVIAVRTDLGMGKGKIAAQCSHAAVGSFKQAGKRYPQYLTGWEREGQPKIVVKLDKDGEDGLYNLAEAAKKLNIPSKVIHDAGLTQIASGSATVVAVGPGPGSLVDSVTGHLKLL